MHASNPVHDAGARIEVDYAAIRSLAARLRDLAQHLSSAGGIVQPELDSDLFGRLAYVQSDWSRHRRNVQSFLSGTADSLDQIVARYEKTNDMIASAATVRG